MKKTTIFYFLISFILFSPIFSGKTLYLKDFYILDYPIWHFVAKALKRGIIPMWNPLLNFGQPILTNGNYLIFYPLSYIRIFFFPLFSLNLFVMLHHFLGMLFFHKLLKEMDIDEKISLLGGVIYGFTGVVISLFYLINLLPYIFLTPFFLLSLIKLLKNEGNNFRNIFILSISTTLVISTFEPLFFMGTALSGIFILMGQKLPPDTLKKILVSILLSSLISLPLLIEGYKDYTGNMRSLLNKEVKNLSRGYDFPPEASGGFFFDNFFKEDFKISNSKNIYKKYGARSPLFMTFFLSSSLLLPFFYFFFYIKKRDLFLPLGVIIFLILSMGGYCPIVKKSFHLIPIISNGRYFQKFTFFFSLFFLITSIKGFKEIIYRYSRKNLVFSLFLSVILLSSLLLISPGKFFISPIFLLIFFFLLFISKRDFQKRYLIMSVVLFELLFGNLRFIKFDVINQKRYSIKNLDKKYRMTFLMDTQIITKKNETIKEYIEKLTSIKYPFLGFLDNTSYGFNEPVDLMEETHTAKLSQFFRRLTMSQKIEIARKLNVKYITTTKNLPLKKIWEKNDFKLYEIDAYPKFYFSRGIRIGDIATLLNPELKYITVTKIPIGNGFNFNGGKILSIKDEINKKELEVISNGKNLLIINETYSPNWSCYIDGKRVKIFRVNDNFMGVLIPKGKHELRLNYLPSTLPPAIFISILTIILSLYLGRKATISTSNST